MAISLPPVNSAWPITGTCSALPHEGCLNGVAAPLPTLPIPGYGWQDFTSPLQLCLTSLTASSNELNCRSSATVEAIASTIAKSSQSNAGVNNRLLVSQHPCRQWSRVQQNHIAVSTADQDNDRAALFASRLNSSTGSVHCNNATRPMPARVTGAYASQLQRTASIPPLVGPLTGLIGRTGYTTPSALLSSAKSLSGPLNKTSQSKKTAPIQIVDSPSSSPNSQQTSTKSTANISSLKRRHVPDVPLLTASPPAKKPREVIIPSPSPQKPHIDPKQPVKQDGSVQTEGCTTKCSCHDIEQLVPLDAQQLVEKFNKHLNVMAQTLKIKSKSQPAKPSPNEESCSNNDKANNSMLDPCSDLNDYAPHTCSQSRSSETRPSPTNQTHGQSARRQQRSLSAEQVEYLSSSHHSPSPSLSNTLSTLRPCVRCSRPAVFVCSKCRLVWYCSTSCQAESWLKHCANCSDVVNLAVAENKQTGVTH